MAFTRFVLVTLWLCVAVTWCSSGPLDILHLLPRQSANLQIWSNILKSFTGALGGQVAPPITNSGDPSRPFLVGGSTFPDFNTAAQRSCDNQHNACADEANRTGNKVFKVSDCDAQNTQCVAAQASAPVKDFSVASAAPSPTSFVDGDFDIICDL